MDSIKHEKSSDKRSNLKHLFFKTGPQCKSTRIQTQCYAKLSHLSYQIIYLFFSYCCSTESTEERNHFIIISIIILQCDTTINTQGYLLANVSQLNTQLPHIMSLESRQMNQGVKHRFYFLKQQREPNGYILKRKYRTYWKHADAKRLQRSPRRVIQRANSSRSKLKCSY